MGYCINQVDSKFRIPAARKAEALAIMKTMDPAQKGAGYWDGRRQWSWVDQANVNKANSLEEAMTEWRYVPTVDAEGNITDVTFEGQKLGQEDVLFALLAPFVEEGSFIEMEGEDRSVWRWIFKGGVVKEVSPTVEWPE